MKTHLLAAILLILPFYAHAVIEIQVTDDNEAVYDVSFGADEIKNSGAGTVQQLLTGVTEFNVVTKTFASAQSDVFLNGGSFEHVAVLIDGIRVNDPQTGHYSMNLPLTILDVERTGVIKNASSIMGAGAFSGAVSVDTGDTVKDKAALRTGYGSYDTKFAAASFGKDFGPAGLKVSAEKNVSNGFHAATGYDKNTVYLKFAAPSLFSLSAGYDEKNYGVFDFYSPGAGNESYDYNVTRYASLKLFPGSKAGVTAYLRNMRDIFKYNDIYPVNVHETYLYGAQAYYRNKFLYGGRFSFTYGITREEIQSSNIGSRSRNRHTLLANLFIFPIQGTEVIANMALESLSTRQGADLLPGVNLIQAFENGLKVRAGYNHAVRYPTFTDLYYNSALNIGDPNLMPERNHELPFGFELPVGGAIVSADFAFRMNYDMIDWADSGLRASKGAVIWKIMNIGRVNTLSLTPGIKGMAGDISYSASHTFLTASADTGYVSKYGVTYLKNNFSSEIAYENPLIRPSLTYAYKNYINRGDYMSSLGAALTIRPSELLEIRLAANNLFDHYFEEVPGIPAMGRYVESSITAGF